MNNNIRIKATFRCHRKINRLRTMIGDRAAEYLINLWIGVSQVDPDGNMKNWDALDIAHEARFGGDPEALVNALMHDKIRLLEKREDGGYNIHDFSADNEQ